MTLREAKILVRDSLQDDPRLMGIGLGNQCIRITWSEEPTPELEAKCRALAGEWPVEFYEVGPAEAF